MGEEPMINNGNDFNYFWVIILMFKDVFLGLVGGLISYLFDYSKAKKNGNEEFIFRVSGMIINMSLGAFVGYVIGTLLPIETTGRDAIIALSGVTSYNILLLAESRFAVWVFERVTGKGTSDNKGSRDGMDDTVQR